MSDEINNYINEYTLRIHSTINNFLYSNYIYNQKFCVRLCITL